MDISDLRRRERRTKMEGSLNRYGRSEEPPRLRRVDAEDTALPRAEEAGELEENGDISRDILDASRSARSRGKLNDRRAMDFDGLLLGTIEDILRKVLGEPSMNLILQRIEKGRSLRREEIPRRAATFALALHEILGVGSVLIEMSILRSLHSMLGLKFEDGERGFTEHVEELRRRFEGEKGF